METMEESERLRAIGMVRIHVVCCWLLLTRKSVGGLLNLMIAICVMIENSPSSVIRNNVRSNKCVLFLISTFFVVYEKSVGSFKNFPLKIFPRACY